MKYILFFVFGVFFVTTSLACDCEYGGNFLKATESSNTIAKIKVLEHLSLSRGPYEYKTKAIKGEIIDLIRGTENRKIVYIVNSSSMLCYQSTSCFETGKTYIMSLLYDLVETYSLCNCSEQWLEYLPNTNEVKGKIKGRSQNRRVRTFDYERLVKRLR